jgi:hypothetical protein
LVPEQVAEIVSTSRNVAAFRTCVTAWPLDSAAFGVARCQLTVCSSCFVCIVTLLCSALHTIQSALYTCSSCFVCIVTLLCSAHDTVSSLHLPHVDVFINKSVVLINTKFQQSELEATTYTLSGSQ